MTKEVFMLIVRRVLTILGTLLIAFGASQEDTQKMTEAVSQAAGAVFIAVDLVWATYRVWKRGKTTTLLLAFGSLFLVGCSTVTLTDPSGFSITRKSYPFSSSQLQSFSMSVGADGVRTLTVGGYNYESKDSVSAIAAAAAQGAIEGMKAK
jgi:hypothetical protein